MLQLSKEEADGFLAKAIFIDERNKIFRVDFETIDEMAVARARLALFNKRGETEKQYKLIINGDRIVEKAEILVRKMGEETGVDIRIRPPLNIRRD